MEVDRRRKEASALRTLFHEQWQFLIKLLGVDEEEMLEGQGGDLPVGDAIDEIVEGTDARVRAVYHYKSHLRAGVRKLLGHIDEIVGKLAEPIKLSRKSFIYDPQASSLLGSMQEVERLCDESDEIREYIKSSRVAGQDRFFALLFMNYHEKVIYGDELRGDVIHRDVRQTSVYFTGHRFLAPAATVSEVEIELKHILLENVVEYLKWLLCGERRYETSTTDINPISNSLESLNNPSRYLDELVTILELPLDLICLEENSICINKMGIKASSADRSHTEIHLQEVEIGGNHSNLLALVEIEFGDIS